MPVDLGPSPKIVVPQGISQPEATSTQTFESAALGTAAAVVGGGVAAGLAGLAMGNEPPLADRNEFMYQPQFTGDEEETQEAVSFAPPEEILAEPTPVFQFGESAPEPEASAEEWIADAEVEEAVDLDESALDDSVDLADMAESPAMVGDGAWANDAEEPLDLSAADENIIALDDAEFEELSGEDVATEEFPDLDDLNT